MDHVTLQTTEWNSTLVTKVAKHYSLLFQHQQLKVSGSSTLNLIKFHDAIFYPRDAMLARVIAIATCLSVRHAPVLCQNEES